MSREVPPYRPMRNAIGHIERGQREIPTANGCAEYRPSPWHRIAGWRRWPWNPDPVPSAFGPRWTTRVRECGTLIGCHHDERRPNGFDVRVSRWMCLRGLIAGDLRYEIEVDESLSHEMPADLLG